jgi:hypothetical protein
MTNRILSVELRRSPAQWSAAVLSVLGALVLYTSNPPYEWWIALVVTQRDTLSVFWPLALGAGAWQAARGRRNRVDELIATTPRPRWQRVLPSALALAIAVAAAYLVTLATSTGHLQPTPWSLPANLLPVIAVGAVSLVAAAWLGMAIGSLLPSIMTPPVLTVTGIAAVAVAPSLLFGQDDRPPGAMLLLPYLQFPKNGAIENLTVSTSVSIAQALWFTALAATGFALLAAATRLARAAALLPAIVGAVTAALLLPAQLDGAYVPAAAAGTPAHAPGSRPHHTPPVPGGPR